MARWQRHVRLAHDLAHHGQARVLFDGGGEHPAMTLRGDVVQDDAGHMHILAEIPEAFCDGGHGLALTGAIKHQHHGQAEHGRQIGGGARALGRAVEKAHDAFDDEQLGVPRGGAQMAGQAGAAHGPGIEIEAGAARGGGVKGRVDVIGPHLGGGDHDAALTHQRQQREGDQRLAAVGGRSGDEQGFSQGAAPSRRTRTSRAGHARLRPAR